jgi:hemolysin activation/secretion protein
LEQVILSYGYVTTVVLFPEPQHLEAGSGKIAIVPGVVRYLRFADPDARGTWQSAFPTRDGDLLDLPDLEQGWVQMKHVANQSVDMKIEPTGTPGESHVVLTVERRNPWTFVASVGQFGYTGNRQMAR